MGLLSRNRVQALVVAASVVSFWPWLMKKDMSPILVDVNPEVVSFVSVASLALLLPLLLDWAVGKVGQLLAADIGAKVDRNLQFHLNDFEKITLFAGLALGPVVALASDAFICPSCKTDFAMLYFTAARFEIVAVVGTFWASFHRFDPTVWSLWSTVLGVVVLTAAVNVASDALLTGEHVQQESVASTVLVAVTILGLLLPAARWLKQAALKMRQGDEKENFDPTLSGNGNSGHNGSSEPNPSRLVFPAAFVVIGTVSCVSVLIMVAISGPIHRLNTTVVVFFLGFFVGLKVALLFYVKLIELESIYHLAEVLQAKKAFMRYTAHEIRTPLNAAMLGAKLILTTLSGVEADDRDELDDEMLETANDVTKVRASSLAKKKGHVSLVL